MNAVLRISAVAHDVFEAEWTFGEDTRSINPRIPFRQLDALGLAGRLEAADYVGVDASARQYAWLLSSSLGFEEAFSEWGNCPLLVVAIGGAAESNVLWETLRLQGEGKTPVAVVRLLSGSDRERDPQGPGDCPETGDSTICWLGSRAANDPLPRFGILAEVLGALRPYETLRPRLIRTSLNALDGIDLGMGGILHIDAHGLVKSDPALGSMASRRTVGISLGGTFVSGDELLNHVARASPRLVVSNACHTSDHVRDESALIPELLRQIPSLQAVAAAYGTLSAHSAARFAIEFYKNLAAGKSILEAHQLGVANAAMELQEADERTKATVQPVLWASGPDALRACLVKGSTPAPDSYVDSVWLRLASLGLVVGQALEAIEDCAVSGSSFPELVFHWADWDQRSAYELGAAVAWAFEPMFTGGQRARIDVPGTSLAEVAWLLRILYPSGSPLVQVLARLVPSIRALAELGMHPGEPVAEALMKACQIGGRRVAPDSHEKAFSARFKGSPSRKLTVAGCFPLVALSERRVVRGVASLPLLAETTDSPLLRKVLTTAEDATGTVFGEFSIAFGHVCRAYADPRLVAAAFVQENIQETNVSNKVPWDEVANAALASRIVGTVACRQLGALDPQLLETVRLIARHSYAEAIKFLESLDAGLPGWAPLDDSLRSAFSGILGAIKDGDITASRSTPPHAFEWRSALKAGDRDAVRAFAHHLSATDPETAAEIAVALLSNPQRWSSHDVAENYHLMAHVQEALGRTYAAIQWMKKERAVPPPTNHRLLHCLDHLLALLRIDGARSDEVYALIQDGLITSRAAEDQTAIDHWLREAIVQGLDGARADWLEPHLGEAVERQLFTRHLCDLARGFIALERGGDGVSLLRSALGGEGTIAAHAALLLARTEPDDADDLLRDGVRKAPPGLYRDACADELIFRALRQHGVAQIVPLLDELETSGVSGGLIVFVRGVHEVYGGNEDHAVRVWSSRLLLGSVEIYDKALAALDAPEARVAGIERLIVTTLILVADAAVRRRTQGIWLRLDELLTTYISRTAELPISFRVDVANDLRVLSESLWDLGGRENLRFAADLRRHVCDVLETIDSPTARRLFASELGWLAVLYRQSERWDESRDSFRRALRLADSHLPREDRALMRGRYGNLLDSLGEYRPAVLQQWAAICDSVGMQLDTAPNPGNYWHALGLNPPAMLVLNWANCLEHDGDRQTALLAFVWAWDHTEDSSRSHEMKRLMSSLAVRLRGPLELAPPKS